MPTFKPGIKTAYKLSNLDGTQTYVGVTGNMKERLQGHRSWKSANGSTSKIFKGVFTVEELEDAYCATYKEQAELERYYFDIYTLTNVNKFVPGRTKAESKAAYRASPKGKAVEAASSAAYRATPEAKKKQKAYCATPEHRAIRKAARDIPATKLAKAAYHATPERRAIQKAYEKTPEAKAVRDARRAIPANREAHKAYMKIYRKKQKEK